MNKLNTTESMDSIGRKPFILGMITAFAEWVTRESKKPALSPPFYPADCHSYETQNPPKIPAREYFSNPETGLSDNFSTSPVSQIDAQATGRHSNNSTDTSRINPFI
jgi:hypothetical protein